MNAKTEHVGSNFVQPDNPRVTCRECGLTFDAWYGCFGLCKACRLGFDTCLRCGMTFAAAREGHGRQERCAHCGMLITVTLTDERDRHPRRVACEVSR